MNPSQQPRLVGLKGRHPNPLSALFSAQISGRAAKSVCRLPSAVEIRLQRETDGLVALLRQTERQLVLKNTDTCRQSLTSIVRYINVDSTNGISHREHFVTLGGEIIIIRMLLSPFPPPPLTEDDILRMQYAAAHAEAHAAAQGQHVLLPRQDALAAAHARAAHVHATHPRVAMARAQNPRGEEVGPTPLQLLQNEGLSILRDLCFMTNPLSELLGLHKEFLIHLFRLMESPVTFDCGKIPTPVGNSRGLERDPHAHFEPNKTLSHVGVAFAYAPSTISAQLDLKSVPAGRWRERNGWLSCLANTISSQETQLPSGPRKERTFYCFRDVGTGQLHPNPPSATKKAPGLYSEAASPEWHQMRQPIDSETSTEGLARLFLSIPFLVCTAVALAEEILAVREETLNVQDVPDFSKLVCSLSARQLAYFCRVLAMVVFEPEVGGGGGVAVVEIHRGFRTGGHEDAGKCRGKQVFDRRMS